MMSTLEWFKNLFFNSSKTPIENPNRDALAITSKNQDIKPPKK